MTTPTDRSRAAPSAWTLGWRALWRDWRAGELTVLVLAIALAVAALTAVAFFADRLQAGLQRDARQLLGGDVVLRSDHPVPPEYEAQARALGLAVTRHLTFPTMARADDADGGEARLVSLKAVAAGYPLRGELRTTTDPEDVVGQAGPGTPPAGEAWVDAALLEVLNLRLGQPLWLGDRPFRLTRIVALEPDRGAGFLSFAPRVLIAESDLAATGLVQPASRIQYRLVVAGDAAAVRRFEAWAKARLADTGERGTQIESFESGRPELQQTLQRAEQFLSLVALLAALLAAVAVAVAARQYALRHLDDCALLRVLGLAQATMARAYAVAFGLAGLAAAAVGTAVGFGVHFVFVWWLSGLMQTQLPAAGWAPVGLGLGVGLVLMATFGLPPVLQLARVPPLRVIRRDVGGLQPATLAVFGGGALGFAALLLAASRDLTLGVIAVGGFAAAVGIFAAVAWGALGALRLLVRETHAPRWLVLATRQITARPAYAVVQVASLAVGLLALVLLVLLRTDLIDSWRQATPPDAPNRFVINIQPDQAEPFRAHLQAQGVDRYDWYPMVRGRLVAINGQPVRPEQFNGDRAQRLVEREFNLSYSRELPAHNPLAAGRWQPDEAGAISIETGLAETLGLRLGDRMTFDIAGVPHEARITSLRKVDWASMHVNFFALFPVQSMPAEVPYTYIAAFRAPAQAGFDRLLLQRFPNVTNVDTSAAVAQVQRVLGQVIRAVEFLFGFSLAAGVVVLLATVGATRAERERDYAVLRALGAQSGLLRRVQRTELLGVGALAGALASAVAVAVGWALARFVFDFDWSVSGWVPLAGTGVGAGLALLAGWWTLRGVLRTPVVQTLRRAAQ
ncbi:MacB-like periplasmic core domain protein [Tepidimonas fonticaldi]|uniref:MacB-like periplasmic core domain protein n=1 Tax=Tepidimonas fonticaldi TaxID=1101373 RepID=A0A554XJH0_9BURK|nr:FtsX-like permease family protein [Tepidimonas fonticaldi]TSE35938.1 MacB-like periplasmic core domain protein [Tepidimonas fonticaldi]